MQEPPLDSPVPSESPETPGASDAPAAPARPLNRLGIGSLSLLQTLLLAVILLILNYLSFHHFTRMDLSRGGDYSLSPATRRYLLSEELSAREKPVRWVVALRRVSPFYERVRALAEEYARLSGGKIALEIVDPLRSPDRMQEVTAAYGITLVRDLVIIDARTDDSPATTEDAGKIRSLHPNVKLVVADDMGVFTVADGRRRITAFQGEDVLTARLVEAVEGSPRRMALLADKSRMDDSDENPAWKSFEDILRFQNIELAGLQIAGLEEIPEDLAGVVLAAPKYDFSESEIAVLERYWNRPRAAVLVLVDGGEIPPRLRAFLRANGVTARKDRVIARLKDKLVTSARGSFTKGVSFTADLAGQSTEFGGASSSLDVREDAEDLLNRQIHPMGLIEVADGFWGETRFGQGDEAFDEREDHPPPLHLAAAVTRGSESDDRFSADTARMVVISNTDFLDPRHHLAENLDFLASSANWLVGREALAGIGPRSLGTYKLPLLDAQVSFINRVNLFFLPAILLVVGAFIWSSRRV
jgi:hypothetical protein